MTFLGHHLEVILDLILVTLFGPSFDIDFGPHFMVTFRQLFGPILLPEAKARLCHFFARHA